MSSVPDTEHIHILAFVQRDGDYHRQWLYSAVQDDDYMFYDFFLIDFFKQFSHITTLFMERCESYSTS